MAQQPFTCNSAAINALLRHCHIRKYPNKIAVIKPGSFGDTLYYIMQGSVVVSMPDEHQDHDIVLAYLNQNDFIGEMSIFITEVPRAVTVKTREPSQLAEIGYQRLRELLKTELASYAIDLLYVLGQQMATRLLKTSQRVGDLNFLDVTGRIARTLLDLCKQPDAMTHPDGMQIRITRQEIGRIVGCSREVAGKVLHDLENKGLIAVSGKTIVVRGTR